MFCIEQTKKVISVFIIHYSLFIILLMLKNISQRQKCILGNLTLNSNTSDLLSVLSLLISELFWSKSIIHHFKVAIS